MAMPSPTRYIPEPNSGCWLWEGAPSHQGYGRHGWKEDGRTVEVPAHRAVYETLVGPIPKGLQIDHLCRNKMCVNPDHLEPVTCKENVARGRGPATTRGRGFARAECPNGHPYTARSTRWIGGGLYRKCRVCVMEKMRRLRAKRRLRTA